MNKKTELINFYKEFAEIMDKENLWFIATCGTLLGAIREGKMIEWDDDIDLGISFETYKYLKTKYPNNILDTDVKGYPFLFPKWVPNINTINESNLFLDLFLIVPTSNKKIKKFKKFKNIFKYSNQMFNQKTLWKPFNLQLKLLKIILWPFQWTTKKLTIDNAFNILYESNAKIFLLLNAPNSNIKSETFLKNILVRKKVSFDNTWIYVPQDSHSILKIAYGDDYMVPSRAKHDFEHIDTINIRKRKNNESR